MGIQLPDSDFTASEFLLKQACLCIPLLQGLAQLLDLGFKSTDLCNL